MADGPPAKKPLANPAPDWLSSRAWTNICSLAALPTYNGLDQEFSKYITQFRAIFDNAQPEQMSLPGKWETSLSLFQKLLVLKTFRADRMSLALQGYFYFLYKLITLDLFQLHSDHGSLNLKQVIWP